VGVAAALGDVHPVAGTSCQVASPFTSTYVT
jgi:hypothetical protein